MALLFVTRGAQYNLRSVITVSGLHSMVAVCQLTCAVIEFLGGLMGA